MLVCSCRPSLLEATFAWLMCFGLMGLFRLVAARERPWLRLLADAAFLDPT